MTNAVQSPQKPSSRLRNPSPPIPGSHTQRRRCGCVLLRTHVNSKRMSTGQRLRERPPNLDRAALLQPPQLATRNA